MNISVQLFVVKWKMIMAAMVVLIAGKVAVMMAAGAMFGLPRMASLRAGRQEQQQYEAFYAHTQHGPYHTQSLQRGQQPQLAEYAGSSVQDEDWTLCYVKLGPVMQLHDHTLHAG